MQNGLYEEGWLELSNRFSMNLTKVLFVAFIFLFALSFAAAAAAAETETPAKPAATQSKGRASPLLQVVLYGGLLLGACFGLVVVYPKSGAMAWIMTKLPTLYFKVPQEVSDNIKQSHPYQTFKWFYVSYKGYSLIFEGGVAFAVGVFLFAKNLRPLAMHCAYPVLEYGILTLLFVSIDISSYPRWKMSILIEEGRNVSKTVNISDHMLHMAMVIFAFARVVLKEFHSLNNDIRASSLNRVQRVFLLLWNSVALLALILHVVMLYYTISWHHPVVDTIATSIVFIGIYLPITTIIDIAINDIILSRIVRSLPQSETEQGGATTGKLHTVSTKGRSAGKTDLEETETVKVVV